MLVLAGDIDAATAQAAGREIFRRHPARPAGASCPPPPIPTLAAPKVETIKDRVATTRLYRMWAVPGLNDPDSVALDVAAAVLGGLSSSRLDNALVARRSSRCRRRASNESFAQLGMFQITVDVKPGVDPALVDKRLDAILADFLKTGPTADEVQRIATTAAVRRIAGLESVGGFGGKAVALAQGALYSNDPDHLQEGAGDPRRRDAGARQGRRRQMAVAAGLRTDRRTRRARRLCRRPPHPPRRRPRPQRRADAHARCNARRRQGRRHCPFRRSSAPGCRTASSWSTPSAPPCR